MWGTYVTVLLEIWVWGAYVIDKEGNMGVGCLCHSLTGKYWCGVPMSQSLTGKYGCWVLMSQSYREIWVLGAYVIDKEGNMGVGYLCHRVLQGNTGVRYLHNKVFVNFTGCLVLF